MALVVLVRRKIFFFFLFFTTLRVAQLKMDIKLKIVERSLSVKFRVKFYLGDNF